LTDTGTDNSFSSACILFDYSEALQDPNDAETHTTLWANVFQIGLLFLM